MGRRSSGTFLLHLVQSILIGLEEDDSFLPLRGMQVSFYSCSFVSSFEPKALMNENVNSYLHRILFLSHFEVWNGIAQWLGVDTDEDLDWILPNRQKFGSSLFSGHDLFTDSPVWTPAPVGPSKSPTPQPTPVPTFPIHSPTASPVVPTTTLLQIVGDGGSNLGLCQGDCDTDGDCQPG
jgi:hypothetical protein